MKKNNNLPLFIGLAVAFGIILGSFFNVKNVGKIYNPNKAEGGKLSSILKYIESEYVDDVDANKITEEVITDMLHKLDPHSSYLPKEVQQYTKETMDGNFVGIGIQFVVKKDSVVVLKVLPDGPSKKAGIRAGDRLLIANKDTLYGKELSSEDIVKILKGAEKTQVLIKAYRPSDEKEIEFNITRGKIAIKSVPAAFKLNENLGYIKIDRFAMTTYDEFKSALDTLQEEGIQDLVLDLRGNPGGFMHIADEIADEFLEDGKLIVYTKNKKGRQQNSVATSKGSFEKGHIYVLVDENSASASEIVSGALQDNDRGTIIGRRTFGKGLVQQEVDFNDGSAVRLTIARYYTPTGRCIQKPYKNNDYEDEVAERYKSGELFYRDSIKVIDSLKYTTPKGKIVYGGGGITPDVFVPLDTTNLINYYQLSLMNNYVYNYIDQHRTELQKYNAANFIDEFEVTDQMLKDFEGKSSQFQSKSSKQLKALLKEIFAETLINDKVYYQVTQLRDPYIKKVIEVQQNQDD